MVSAHNHAFSRSIYRKKTFTGLYTKWDSLTTQKYKTHHIRTLTFRCYSLSLSLLSCSLDELRDLLLPRRLFLAQRCVELEHTVLVMFLTGNETVPKKEVFLILPYLGLQTRIFTRQVKACINKFNGCFELRVVFQSTHCIKSLFPCKAGSPVLKCSNVRDVYKAICWDCQEFFIGKTKRSLHERNTEHFKSILHLICTSPIIHLV